MIIPSPYWVSYPEQVRVAEANPVFVPTREEDGFRLTPQRLASVLTFNTKMIILNYPSNPTGVCYSGEELAELADHRLDDGQFDDSNLTLRELRAIEDSMIKSLIANYHGRVKYPGQRSRKMIMNVLYAPVRE